MVGRFGILLAAAGWFLTGCSTPPRQSAETTKADDPGPKITQLYATVSPVPRGATSLLCYGVENARTVWLSPPKKELSAALTRCVEVAPETDTTYTLTAEGADGKSVTRELKIAVGAAHVKIGNVTISAVEVKPQDLVSICWEAANARTVTIAPLTYRRDNASKGCATDQPVKTTTYTIKASGSGGDQDEEKITVKVR